MKDTAGAAHRRGREQGMATVVEGQVVMVAAVFRLLLVSILATTVGACAVGVMCNSGAGRSLAGTWTLLAADQLLPDGKVTRDYGEAPQGRLMIDSLGRYSIQIFRSERPAFAAAEKSRGTHGELRAAVLGSSTHYGTLSADWTAGTLTFTIEDASFPNWRGTTQVRSFELEGDTLTYRVPPRPDGSIPISVWRRVERNLAP